MVTRNAGWIVAVGSIAGLSRHPREASHRSKVCTTIARNNARTYSCAVWSQKCLGSHGPAVHRERPQMGAATGQEVRFEAGEGPRLARDALRG